MTIEHRGKRMAGRAKAFTLLLCLSSFLLWGCGSGGSGSNTGDVLNETVAEPGTYSAKAMIGSSTGGVITVETDEGVQVTIQFPSRAMDYSKEISLSVTESDLSSENPILTLDIEPSVALWEGAQLTVTFPEEVDVSQMIVCRKDSDFMPLKQGQAGRSIIAVLYRLGEFSYSAQDEETMIEIAYTIIDQAPSGEWQESYASFDALLWLYDYFKATGNRQEAVSCFNALAEVSLQQTERFIDSVGTLEKESLEYRALEKFKHLMALCENPQGINQAIDALLGTAL